MTKTETISQNLKINRNTTKPKKNSYCESETLFRKPNLILKLPHARFTRFVFLSRKQFAILRRNINEYTHTTQNVCNARESRYLSRIERTRLILSRVRSDLRLDARGLIGRRVTKWPEMRSQAHKASSLEKIAITATHDVCWWWREGSFHCPGNLQTEFMAREKYISSRRVFYFEDRLLYPSIASIRGRQRMSYM